MENCIAIVLPDTVVSIFDQGMFRNKKMKYVHLGNSLEKLWNEVFDECESLESVVLPDSLKEMEGLVFNHNQSLKSLTIPASVTDISEVFISSKNVNPDLVIRTPKGSVAEEIRKNQGYKVVNY